MRSAATIHPDWDNLSLRCCEFLFILGCVSQGRAQEEAVNNVAEAM